MPQLSANQTFSIDGNSYSQVQLVNADGKVERKKSNFPAALVATFTTRTDNDTGVLTFTSNPSLSVGQRVDVYWSGGMRRGMKVSNVSGTGPYLVTVGTASPGDTGAGDNFPSAPSAMTVGISQAYDFHFTGDNLQALVAACPCQGVIVIADASDVELWSAVFKTSIGGVADWVTGNGTTNPLAAVTPAKVWMSHADNTQTREVKAAALIA